MVYVGIMGHGTVGSGVVEVLQKNRESITRKVGDEICVKRILDLKDFSNLPYSALFTKDADDILNDGEISIVVEVMGGIEPAYSFTKRALNAGKHVVTSNKELVAQHGSELLKIAREKNVNYLFEASVGGGIPIIRPLKQCLAGNNISEITGILNGTTNFILSEMKNKDKDFDEALRDAQAKGYAERDPSADIEGHDAQRKIAILASIAYGCQIPFNEIHTEGITSITRDDILFGHEMNCAIKLVAAAKKDGGGIRAGVFPVMLNFTNPLADVEDVFNAILVKGDAIGDVMFYGKGAGKLPTASAVVGDVIDTAKHLDNMINDIPEDGEAVEILDIGRTNSAFFVRLKVKNARLFEEEARELLPNSRIILPGHPDLEGQAAIILGPIQEDSLGQRLNNLLSLPSVENVLNTIRIWDSEC
jgi:homoserine dehydrogenase